MPFLLDSLRVTCVYPACSVPRVQKSKLCAHVVDFFCGHRELQEKRCKVRIFTQNSASWMLGLLWLLLLLGRVYALLVVRRERLSLRIFFLGNRSKRLLPREPTVPRVGSFVFGLSSPPYKVFL